MNVAEIYDDVIKICKIVTRNDELHEDLAHEVCISLLESKNVDRPLGLAFRIAWVKWNTNNGAPDGTIRNCFKYVYRDFTKNFIDIDELHKLPSIEVEEDTRLKDVLSKLPELERQILNEYVRKGCEISQFSKHSGVKRKSLDKRVKQIIEKCKKF